MEDLSNELHNKLHDLKSHFLDLDDLLWERDHEMYTKDPKMSARLDSELDTSFRSLSKEVKHMNHLVKQYIDSEIITEKVALGFMKEESEKGESGRHPNGDISLTEVLDYLDENSSTREIKKHEKRVFSNAEMENAFLLDTHFKLKGHERAGILYSGSGLEKSIKDAIGLSNFVSSFGKILDKRVIKGKPDEEIKRVMDTQVDEDLPDDVDFELYQLPLSKRKQDMDAEEEKLKQHNDIVKDGEIVDGSHLARRHHNHDEEMTKRLGKTINMQHGNHIIHEQASHVSHEVMDLHSDHNNSPQSLSKDMYSENMHDEDLHDQTSQSNISQEHEKMQTQSEILGLKHNDHHSEKSPNDEVESDHNQSQDQSVDNIEVETPAKFVDKNGEGGQTVQVDNDPIDRRTEIVDQKKNLLSHKLTYERKRNAYRKLKKKNKRRKLLNETPESSAETSLESMDANEIDQGMEASQLEDSNHNHYDRLSTNLEASPPLSEIQDDTSQPSEIDKEDHTSTIHDETQDTQHVSEKDPSLEAEPPKKIATDPSEISVSNIDHINEMNQDVDEDDVSPDHYHLRGKPYTKHDVAQVNQEADKYRRETPLDLAEDREKRKKDDDSEMDSREREEAKLKKLEKLGYPKVERIDTHFDNPFNAYGIKRMDLTGSVKKFDGTPDLQDTYHTLNKMFSLPYQDMKAALLENKEFQGGKIQGPDFVNIDKDHDKFHRRAKNQGSRSPISDLQQQKDRRLRSGNFARRTKIPNRERRLRVVYPSNYQRTRYRNPMMRGKIISDEPVYQKHSFMSQQDLMGYKRNLRPVNNVKNINQWHNDLMGGTEKMSKRGLKTQTDRIYQNMLRMRF